MRCRISRKPSSIEGIVHVPSPVRQRRHSAPHSSLVGWLFLYRARTPGVELGDNPSVRLDLGNMPQPDAVLFVQPESRGQVKIDADDYINGGPISSPKSPPAARVTTCTRNSRRTSATVYASTSSGASSSARSTGSSCMREGTNGSPRPKMGPCAARCFPASGWTRPHSCVTISIRCWTCSSAAWTPRSTRDSPPAWGRLEPSRRVEGRSDRDRRKVGSAPQNPPALKAVLPSVARCPCRREAGGKSRPPATHRGIDMPVRRDHNYGHNGTQAAILPDL